MSSPLSLLTNAVLIFDATVGSDISGGSGTPLFVAEPFILIAYLKRKGDRSVREGWDGARFQQLYEGFAITPMTMPSSLQSQQVARVDFYGANVPWPTVPFASVSAYEIFKAAQSAKVGLSGMMSIDIRPPSQVGVDELAGRGFEGTFTQQAQWADVI